MNFLLDTNICIYLMKNRPSSVARRLESLRVGDVAISSITLAELEHGIGVDPAVAPRRKEQLEKLLSFIPALDFDAVAAHCYGKLRAEAIHLGRNRFDTLIAAQAISLKLTLVTNNLRAFSGIDDLVLENWAEE